MVVMRRLTLVVATTVALASCSLVEPERPDPDISDFSVRQVLNAGERRLKDVESVTIKGTGREDGQRLHLDMAFAAESASGSVAYGKVAFRVLSAEGKTYIKPNNAFFRASADLSAAQERQLIRAIDGRWLEPGDDKSLGDIAAFGLRNDFFDDFLVPDGKIKRQPDKRVKGVLCIVLKDREGTLYVDKRDGTPILLSGKSSRLNFSYAALSEFKPPAAADVVTLDELRN